MESPGKDVEAVEAIAGHVFRDKRFLAAALTHQSCRFADSSAENNQRLEFLGDAVLGLLSAEMLYKESGGRDEGFMTVARSRAVSGEHLASVARLSGINRFLRYNRSILPSSPELSSKRTLAALTEALFGALWLDGGMEAVRPFFARYIVPELEKAVLAGGSHIDPRGELQIHSARNHKTMPEYSVECLENRGNVFLFEAEARVAGKSAKATGSSKKEAMAKAARKWLELFGKC